MNYDFALITLAEDALPSTGTLGLYQPPPSGNLSVSLTTAGVLDFHRRLLLCMRSTLIQLRLSSKLSAILAIAGELRSGAGRSKHTH